MIIMVRFDLLVGGVLYPDKVGVGFHADALAGVETGDHPQSVGV
jgi:hypothetical protein